MRAAISLLVMGLFFASMVFMSRGSGRILPNQELMASNHKPNDDHQKPYRGAGRDQRRAYTFSTHTV